MSPTLPLSLALALAALPAAAQGSLFPEPFAVEHRLVQTGPDGEVFAADPVTDHYGGSFVVSVRGDGGRVIVDLARREITEVRPEAGTWWSVSFDRMAELARRVRAADDRVVGRELAARAASAERAGIVVEPLAEARPRRADGVARAAAARSGPPLVALRARAGDDGPALDAWLDPSVRLSSTAREALARLEREALGAGVAADLMAAVRDRADGALPVHTRRAAGGATVEDEVLAVTRLEAFPVELLEVPEGLVRVPHPLEVQAAWLEQEAEHAETTRRSLSR